MNINRALQKVFKAVLKKDTVVMPIEEGTSRSIVPRLTRSITQTSPGIGRKEWLDDEGAFLLDYYHYLRTRVPMVADGIAVWVDLSTSGNTVSLRGGSKLDQEEATRYLEDLNYRAYEFDYEWGAGFQRLTELFYLNFYTNGRFCAEIVPYADMTGIAYVGIVDPFSIKFRREADHIKLYQGGLDEEIPLPKERIFYAAFDPDAKNPMGHSLLDSIRWVVQIKEKLIEDMAKASHNSGFPRLKVSIEQPPQIPGESVKDYVARVNKDFDETVALFRDLAPEDNIFTMSNIVVDYLAPSGGQDFQWSINMDRVEGEVVAGLRLFPWLLGSSSSTTKNWVEAQHDVLMQRVYRGVQHGTRFMNWIRNTELRLKGSVVRANQEYKPLRDPGRLVEERSQQWQFRRIDDMVTRGYISKDEGARQMGLDHAYQQDEVQLPANVSGKSAKPQN